MDAQETADYWQYRREHLDTWVFQALLWVAAVLLAVLMFGLLAFTLTRLEQSREVTREELPVVMREELRDLRDFYHYRALDLLRVPGVLEAMRQQDSAAIERLTYGLYENFLAENPLLRVLQFHRNDGNSLIRLHRLDERGDPIFARREMLQRLLKTQQPQFGLELGVQGLQVRTIEPVFDPGNGAYLGAIEFGIDPAWLATQVEKRMRMPVWVGLAPNLPPAPAGLHWPEGWGAAALLASVPERWTDLAVRLQPQSVDSLWFRGQVLAVHQLRPSFAAAEGAELHYYVIQDLTPIWLGFLSTALLLLMVGGGMLLVLWRLADRTLIRFLAELENSRSQLLGMTTSLGEGLALIETDGRVRWINPSGCRLIGCEESEVRGRYLPELLGCDEVQNQCRIQSAIVAGEKLTEQHFVGRGQLGALHLAVTVTPLLVHGERSGSVVVFRDVSAQEALIALTERERGLFSTGPMVALSWSLPAWQLDFVSSSVSQWEYAPALLLEHRLDFMEMVVPDDRAELTRARQAILEAARERPDDGPFTLELSYRLFRQSGESFWVRDFSSVRFDAEGRPGHLDSYLIDVTRMQQSILELERRQNAAAQRARQLEAEVATMREVAETDLLTGIANRRRIQDQIAHELARHQRYGGEAALILFDIDHFKRVNDHFGHLVGDEVLKEVAQRVRYRLRSTDLLARWGGEEFLVLLPETSVARATSLAEATRLAVAERPFDLVGQVTISLGVAALTDAGSIQQVDEALYAAKDGGRNQVRVAGGGRPPPGQGGPGDAAIPVGTAPTRAQAAARR